MQNTEVLNIKRRREIFDFISKNPGMHLRDLSRKMNIAFSTLKYHLNYLEKTNLIVAVKEGKYSRYFVSEEVGNGEKLIIGFLQKKTTLHIIFWLMIGIQASQKELSRFMLQHPTSVGFHLRKMKKAGLIEEVSIENGAVSREAFPCFVKRSRVSNEKIYVLVDPWHVYDIILKHRKHLIHTELVDHLIYYVEFFIADGIPKEVMNREDTIDSLVETFTYFFFPPSFCS